MLTKNNLETAILHEIYMILIKHCGAQESNKDQFVEYFLNNGKEWRFGGNLGFGGKFYMDNPPRIDCYNEDLNNKRSVIITIVNRLLSAYNFKGEM